MAVTRSSSAGGPRPVDDPPADASLSGRQPIVRTLQPRAKDGSSDRSVDIVDLPQKPERTVSEFTNLIRSQLAGLDGSLNRWRLTRWAALLPKIAALEPELQKLADEQLRKRSLSLRYRAKSGEPLARLLVEGYALVREAGRRTINMRHFDVQMLGGIAMFHRSIVEMQTGEGKTLAATLPMYLHGLLGGDAIWPPSTTISPAATPTGWGRFTNAWA